jgi:hypothetical protein
MMILLSFVPLIAFHALVGFGSTGRAIELGAGLALVVVAVDWTLSSGSVKLLNLGTFVLFAVLLLVGKIADVEWSPLWASLFVNIGLLAIVGFTLAIKQPFTAQYARQETPKAIWNSPTFLHANYVISSVWGLVFVVFVLADLARMFVPSIPNWLDTTVGIVGLVVAAKFTKWYPAKLSAAVRRTGQSGGP